jgi:hypothetical protein
MFFEDILKVEEHNLTFDLYNVELFAMYKKQNSYESDVHASLGISKPLQFSSVGNWSTRAGFPAVALPLGHPLSCAIFQMSGVSVDVQFGDACKTNFLFIKANQIPGFFRKIFTVKEEPKIIHFANIIIWKIFTLST